ncbi:DinB family protein [Phytomonospora sp. NPDC050363]|uniref:DinB family protein n=1 Tax=Phytomonospora sp. NPDC050363 TaxID=3155642 RepID=UPI0033C93462
MTTGNDELATLTRYLTWQREHILGAVDGLSEADLRRPVLPSGWSCLGLIRHLALDVERFWFRAVAAGESVELSDSAWQVDPAIPVEEVLALYRDEIARADAILARTPLDADPMWWPEPGPPRRNLRATILHVTVETATHAGHLDAARELIDGKAWLVLT